MNEPKRRGRPPKVPHINGDESREPETVIEEQAAPVDDTQERAQAYAMRVWGGQSPSLSRADRIARVVSALQGQNLPSDAIQYPAEIGDSSEWTAEDEEPITYRSARAAA